jgi:hypothetical protein
MDQYQMKRSEILSEMAGIEKMRAGRLTEEYRETVVGGEVKRVGPYFKHQVWRDGKNVSTRVAADDAEGLKEGIDGLDRFKKLSKEFVETTIEMTNAAEENEDSGKKNSK